MGFNRVQLPLNPQYKCCCPSVAATPASCCIKRCIFQAFKYPPTPKGIERGGPNQRVAWHPCCCCNPSCPCSCCCWDECIAPGRDGCQLGHCNVTNAVCNSCQAVHAAGFAEARLPKVAAADACHAGPCAGQLHSSTAATATAALGAAAIAATAAAAAAVPWTIPCGACWQLP